MARAHQVSDGKRKWIVLAVALGSERHRTLRIGVLYAITIILVLTVVVRLR
jgi:hypothetical protein